MAAIKQSVAREHGRQAQRRGARRARHPPPVGCLLEPEHPELYEIVARRGEGIISAHGALLVDTGEHTGRAAKDKAIVREPASEEQGLLGRGQQGVPAGEVRQPARTHDAPRLDPRAVRAGHLRGRRPALPTARAHHHGTRVALALRAHDVHQRRRGRGGARARVHRHQHPELQGRPRDRRHALRDLHPDGLRAAPRPHRRHLLRGRDEEVGLHDPQLPAAAARRDVDALLGQRRRRGRRGRLLRAVGDGQDDALAPTPSAASSATTSTAGATTASSTSRAAATPKSSSSPRRPSPTSTARRACSAP